MARLLHGNLVRLLAYCDEVDKRILIYGYMSDISMDLYIFGTYTCIICLAYDLNLDHNRSLNSLL